MVNETTMTRFSNFAATNPMIVRAALRKNFSVSSLSCVADEHDCSIDEEELIDEFKRLAKNTTARVGFFNEEGEFREITLDEASLASGGVAAAVALAYIAVGVYTYVIAASQAAIAINVAVFVSVYAEVAVWG